ncbi:hypothetical protein CC78DRAFT_480267, partial [Lojkania enalia]
VSKDIKAIQLYIDLVDITAVRVYISGRKLIIVLVYILDISLLIRTREENLEELSSRLQAINRLVQQERLYNLYTEVVVASNFNRHNLLWGGSYIDSIVS